jgi:hypothetical protein
LHPWIYRTIVVLAVILILSAWGFFGGGYSGLDLAVISVLIFIAVAIPVILWRIWRRNADRQPDRSEAMSFASWRSRDLEIWGGRVKGAEAMVEVLLPIGAVAFEMAALALVLHFDIGS